MKKFLKNFLKNIDNIFIYDIMNTDRENRREIVMNKEIKITPNGIKQALENLLNENEQLQQENQQQNQLLKDKGFIIDKLMEENRQLKDNWNKLKEIAKSKSDFKLKIRNKELWFEVDELLFKMEELERGEINGFR